MSKQNETEAVEVIPEAPEARDMFPENSITDSIFGEGDVVKYDPAAKVARPAPKKAAESAVPAKAEKPADKADEKGAEDDDEIDWEKEAAANKGEVLEGDDDDDKILKDETVARQQAKLRGRELKKAKQELEEIRLEKERVEKESDSMKSKLEEYEASKLDATEHPDFKALKRDILTDVENAAELMSVSDPSTVVSNFGVFMLDYLKLEGLSGKERGEKLNELKARIVDAVASPEIPYAEMTSDEQAAFSSLTGDVLRLVQRNVRSTKDLYALKDTLESKSKSGVLLKGVREYDAAMAEFKPFLDVIGELPEEVIESDPHNPASVVASMLKADASNKKIVETAKRDVIELVIGPRPLTLDEIKRMEANGTNVKQFLSERDAKFRAKQKKLIPLLIQGLLTRSAFKAALVELEGLRKNKSAEDDEFDALASLKNGKAPKTEKAEKPKVSPVDSLFEED